MVRGAGAAGALDRGDGAGPGADGVGIAECEDVWSAGAAAAAEDGLDPLGLRLLVELNGPEHVAVVGHPDRGLTVLDGLRHHLVEARRPVQHRELGVDVEVGEGIGHGSQS